LTALQCHALPHGSRPCPSDGRFWAQGQGSPSCPASWSPRPKDRGRPVYPDSNTRFVIRASWDRALVDQEKEYLFEKAKTLPNVGTRQVQIAQRGGRPARQAQLTLSSGRVQVRPPKRLSAQYAPIELNVVLAVESAPPAGSEALQWLLLTSEAVDSEAGANEVVTMYAARWMPHPTTVKGGPIGADALPYRRWGRWTAWEGRPASEAYRFIGNIGGWHEGGGGGGRPGKAGRRGARGALRQGSLAEGAHFLHSVGWLVDGQRGVR
jgi:hypothetical protein